jgi:hypothetical protein
MLYVGGSRQQAAGSRIPENDEIPEMLLPALYCPLPLQNPARIKPIR